MRMHRRYALGAALLSAALLAGACGSGGSSGGTSSSNKPALATTLVFGAPPNCPTNPFCQIGLKNTYGIVFKEVKLLDAGGPITVQALKSGTIQVGELFSTSVYDPDFQVLVDDKHLEASDNIVPVMRNAAATPDAVNLLNAVSTKLTTEAMLALNMQVDINKADPAAVAMAFLTQNGLLGAPTTSGNGKALTVGVSQGFGENKIVAEMYGQVLANAGYTVHYQLDLSSRQVSDTALFNGQIDLKPEYLASEAAAQDPNAQVSGDPNNNLTVLSGLLSPKSVMVLQFSPAVDQNVFVVTKETAAKYHLVNVSDLAKPAP
jgi:osmoprotectant transport system substrate-binding protein